MARQNRTVERLIARIASAAHGVITWAEMRAAEISEDEIRHRVKVGALIPEYRGVYRVGHQAPSIEARYMAAVKACGPGALLCGLTAAFLLGLLRLKTPPPPEVITPTERKVKGLKTTRTRNPDRRDATTFNGIPCTTVARTLVDLAAVLTEDELAVACHEAGVKYGATPRQVKAVLERRPNARGAATLRAVMSGDVKVSLSKLEKRFIERLVEADLPLPETNRIATGRRVDCRWRDQKVTVELDSFRFHNSRHSWERGQERQREAYARGDDFRRYTCKDVFEDPRRMLAELPELLA